ncbi:MAG: hypothetical protein ACI4PT_10720, partial [Candidatus Avoscillospira sp.]
PLKGKALECDQTWKCKDLDVTTYYGAVRSCFYIFTRPEGTPSLSIVHCQLSIDKHPPFAGLLAFTEEAAIRRPPVQKNLASSAELCYI